MRILTLIRYDCSGLPGRTSLRRVEHLILLQAITRLFRSSRPDFIETAARFVEQVHRVIDCSGLPGRTSLRQVLLGHIYYAYWQNCSGLPGRTSLRRQLGATTPQNDPGLFRSSRPDFIETPPTWPKSPAHIRIVPVFQAGLH